MDLLTCWDLGEGLGTVSIWRFRERGNYDNAVTFSWTGGRGEQ